MLVKIYAGEITKTPVRANLLDPGIVHTRLRASAFPGEDLSRLPPECVTDAFLALALPECARNGARGSWPPPFRRERMSERERTIQATTTPRAPSSARKPFSANAPSKPAGARLPETDLRASPRYWGRASGVQSGHPRDRDRTLVCAPKLAF
jgi:hypothetical protein